MTLSSKTLLKGELLKNGYKYIEDSFSLSKEQTKLKGKRKYGQMIASRYPFKSRNPDEFSVPWKERILSADINTEYGKIEIHTTHIPPRSTNGWIKIQMLEGIFKMINRNSKKLRILTGDFNTPQFELSDGTIVTWGQKVKYKGSSNGDQSKDIIVYNSVLTRWDTGERNVLNTLKEKNLFDVYRKVNGYDKHDYSWHTNQGRKTGRRFDHIFASVRIESG